MGRKSDAKQRLLDAALDLIWESSYGGVTIDAICEKAGVKKGSFYYFFESKADLAVTALEEQWQSAIKPKFDAMFSVANPPLERIQLMLASTLESQQQLQEEHGRILGCPCFTLGSEISTQNESIRLKIRERLNRTVRYLESAIRDAQAEGAVGSGNPLLKAKAIYILHAGSLTEARIQNSLEPLHLLPEIVMDLLGAPLPAQKA